MTDLVQPDWMDGFQPQPWQGKFKPGQSGNPAGRKPGILDKRNKLQKAFADDAVDVAKKVVELAKAGDMQAASICLARLAPPLRAQAERVQFHLDEDVPLSVQARQILQAVANGELDADTAKMLIGCMQAVAGIAAVEDLASRLAILESKAVNA